MHVIESRYKINFYKCIIDNRYIIWTVDISDRLSIHVIDSRDMLNANEYIIDNPYVTWIVDIKLTVDYPYYLFIT